MFEESILEFSWMIDVFVFEPSLVKKKVLEGL